MYVAVHKSAHTKAIELNSDDVEYLQSLVRTRTIQAQVVDRAKMLLYKAQGESNRNIATRLDVPFILSH